jgi:hypothetical protein
VSSCIPEAVQRAAKLCASLGHLVEEADPKLDMVALRPMNARIAATNTTRSCNMRWKALGREPNADDVEAVTWGCTSAGRVEGERRRLRRSDRYRARSRAQDGHVPDVL